MITFDSNKEKLIKLQITERNNFDLDKSKIYARLMLGGIDFCFPGEIVNEFIIVNIPALKNIIAKEIELNEKKIRIEVISESTYLVPFEDNFNIEQPTKLEAKIIDTKDEEVLNEKKIKTKIIEEEPKKVIPKKKSILDNFLDV